MCVFKHWLPAWLAHIPCCLYAQMALDAAAIQAEVDAAASVAASCGGSNSQLSSAPVVAALWKAVAKAQAVLPQLLLVTSHALRPRHWAQIHALLGLVGTHFLGRSHLRGTITSHTGIANCVGMHV